MVPWFSIQGTPFPEYFFEIFETFFQIFAIGISLLIEDMGIAGGGGRGGQIPPTFPSGGDIISFVPPTFLSWNISKNIK